MRDPALTRPKPIWYYLGPAFLVSVGYMDPGNWATSLEAGSRYGLALLFVVTLSSGVAILMQALAAKLGVVTGKDLAEHLRRFRAWPFLFGVFVFAMMATDLAEFMGVAVALNLLFGLPLVLAALLTVLDVLFILWLERFGHRALEGVITLFVASVGLAYAYEVFLVHPRPSEVALRLFVPEPGGLPTHALYVALGILGATVMPHNLFLHSAQVKTRLSAQEAAPVVYRYALFDTLLALGAAWLVNAAILVVAATLFHDRGLVIADLGEAYRTLSPLLGPAAATVFALALLASGLSSSTTGTLAGQVVFEGFLGRWNAFWGRLGLRLAVMLPAVAALAFSARPMDLLVLSQVLLSLALPFAALPLVALTSSPKVMGPMANPPWLRVLAWGVALVIVGLNLWLLVSALS
ncbi:Nramp family divalent metal transporter [Thermus filiformis]|uniref:Manganese transporter n=1 Tax=Thermus filiformis TaxID=276 RepID=A0A0A2WTI9_THEFI|nr:Nramp family divalent metal transporter [Thermus filiformis]KGQ22072.2 manganese transporter [Thermus filiformis]